MPLTNIPNPVRLDTANLTLPGRMYDMHFHGLVELDAAPPLPPVDHTWFREMGANAMGNGKNIYPPQTYVADVKNLVSRALLVNATGSVEEARMQLDPWTDGKFPIITGYCPFVDLQAEPGAFVRQARSYASSRRIYSVRAMAQGQGPRYYDSDNARTNAETLASLQLPLELLVHADEVIGAARMMSDLQKGGITLPVVLDHAGKPFSGSTADLISWKAAILDLAAAQSATCKLSLGYTEAERSSNSSHHKIPVSLAEHMMVARTVIEAFGPERVMIGSNLPVTKVTSVPTEFGTGTFTAVQCFEVLGLAIADGLDKAKGVGYSLERLSAIMCGKNANAFYGGSTPLRFVTAA